MAPVLPFTRNPLDRASTLREDEAWVQAQLESPASRFLLLSQLEVLTRASDHAQLMWLDSAQWAALGADGTPILLGLGQGAAHFAVDVTSLPDPLARLQLDEARFAEVRGLAPDLPAEDAGIIAQARALIDWHARHRFCSACGAPTLPKRGGGIRHCASCGAQHFPRTDPAVIMVVWRADRCLLGRRRGRPLGAFSALAGFVEQGESIEEAVRREVLEEVGVPVDDVQYYASQPWPFPSSLMIGCFAHAASDESRADEHEIEEARWFSRDNVRSALEGNNADLTFPAPLAIAHHLLRAWAERPLGRPF